MTKTFEEEHIKFNNEYGNCKSAYYQKAVRHHFKDWHSDEEFQEMKESYWNQAESILSMLEEIKSLKSQLQQQALPVVPECVAVQIERVKNSNGNFATLGLFDWNHEAKPDYTKWIHENVFDFMRACTIGYTVEKPQLFYLKHIDMSKADKECDWYLITDCVKLCHEWVGKNLKPKDDDFKFTQSEIDSMETGSYELMPVEDGE